MEETVDQELIKLNKIKKSKDALCRKTSTHLYLQDKNLTKIPIIPNSKNLEVLYLYNNHITAIENLNHLPNLKSLYLQNNNVEQIENLNNVKSLRALFLGHNNISILEGLEHLTLLEELHIERQLLPDNMTLCLDPRTVCSLADTLRVLNVSRNNIDSLESFVPLKHLEIFIASHNNLEDIKSVCCAIKRWYHLKEVNFIGNGITKMHRYRENVIANSYNIELLDHKTVSKTTKEFIKRFEEEKLINVPKEGLNLNDFIDDVPKHHPPGLHKAASAAMLRNSKYKILEHDLSTFDERNAVYIAWNALPKAKPPAKLKGLVRRTGVEKRTATLSDFTFFDQF